MILGHLDTLDVARVPLPDDVSKEVFGWMRAATADHTKPGTYPLRGEDIFVKVQTYPTIARESGRYEVHREYIDIQCTLSGAEIIEWYPATLRPPKTDYDSTRDVWYVETPPAASAALILPRFFALLWPGEAHMPKISDGQHAGVLKLCVKIRAACARLS
jgi:biofilm protein TabA